jgi:RimJ/RimL family protein N-acetyltransferase
VSFYKVLNKQVYSSGEYSIVPIRMEDRYYIMQWRNEQMYHLRQVEPLTEAKQDAYFENVVAKLFDQEQPNQLLFSFLKGEECIGYGGLVHINWVDKNAEISFIMKTALEQDEFEQHWGLFLDLLEQVAFQELKLHKIFTYAFDLRPHLYSTLEKCGFYEEARLKEHCFFNNDYIDVVIHSKINSQIKYEEASLKHAKLLFDWTNEKTVRINSLNTESIKWEDHLRWFNEKLDNPYSHIFIYYLNSKPIGQVRLDLEGQDWLIDYSIDIHFRGRGLGTKILEETVNIETFKRFRAVVKNENKASIYVFKKLGFTSYKSNNEELKEFYYVKS